MLDTNDVAGRVGDLSGKVGDLSGRVGDLSGRVGDLSGRVGDLSGKVGDLSGHTIADVEAVLLSDRQTDAINGLAGQIARLEKDVLRIARWLDNRLRMLEDAIPTNLEARIKTGEGRCSTLEDKGRTFETRLRGVEDKVVALQQAKPPTT
jgi:hypothetical protein